jgi:sugar fermentation stimulation protein A
MQFPQPLVQAELIRRYKRFLADVRFPDGSLATVHCANPGSMLGLAEPGSEVWLSRSGNPARKLAWSWELLRVGRHLVGINTAHPNALAAEAIKAGSIPPLAGYDAVRREVKYGRNSRIDLLLSGAGRADCYVEVKNVHLKRDAAQPGLAEFPDSVTARGAKHLIELADMVAAGHRAVMLYLVQRTDCDSFAIAADIDPTYAAGLDEALAKGVEALCYGCRISREGIEVDRPLALRLDRSRLPPAARGKSIGRR